MFVDWLNVTQEFTGERAPAFIGGRMLSVEGACGLLSVRVPDADGVLHPAFAVYTEAEHGFDDCFDSVRFAQHRGSFETNLFIRWHGGKLEVRGNPSSFGRLDNVFGVSLDDAFEVYNGVLSSLGLPQFTTGVASYREDQQEGKLVRVWDGAKITRCDLTQNVSVGMGRVQDFHRYLARNKLYRSAASDSSLDQSCRWDWNTVYLSESAYWLNVKAYDKASAIEQVTLPGYVRKLKDQVQEGAISKGQAAQLEREATEYLEALACWCAEVGVSRLEWSFKSRYFAQREGLGEWKPGETWDAMREIAGAEMAKISTTCVVRQADAMDSLTPTEFAAYERWRRGCNMKEVLGSVRTFYRLRNSIREKTGHDIAAHPIELVNAPDWRPVYFQMRPLSASHAPTFYRHPEPMRLAA